MYWHEAQLAQTKLTMQISGGLITFFSRPEKNLQSTSMLLPGQFWTLEPHALKNLSPSL